MKALKTLAIYVPLVIIAIVTLVPFAYLTCAAFKTNADFFSSLFLPTTGLFAIDENTGQLTVAAPGFLDAERTTPYTVTIEMTPSNGPAELRTVMIYPPGANAGDEEWAIPSKVEAGDVLGSIAPPETDGPMRYRIKSGNVFGFLGIAWHRITLSHFDKLFNQEGFGRSILNSFFFASVNSILSTLGAAMGGYALAKFNFRGKNVIMVVVLGSLVIPGALMLAPGYQLIYWFGLLDSYTGLILPGLAPAFGIFLFRQAMVNGVPGEMLEAARIDGAGEVRMFFIIAMPMVRPMIGAFILITFMGTWNNFIGPQIMLQTPEKFPLAVAIAQLRGEYSQEYGMIMAGTLVSIAPMLILFLLLQREFIAGLTAGAVKG